MFEERVVLIWLADEAADGDIHVEPCLAADRQRLDVESEGERPRVLLVPVDIGNQLVDVSVSA